MKTSTKLVHGFAITAVALGLGFTSMVAEAGIADTKHNLSNTGSWNHATDAGADQICVFCHTPHAADVSVSGAPLWNKHFTGTSGTYTMYTSDTMQAASGTLGGVSLACLSCHDGTQAFDNMINAPGGGSWTAGGTSQGYTFQDGTGTNVGFTSFAQASGGDESLNLGTDLTNDHPVGIVYCGATTQGDCGTGDSLFHNAVSDANSVWYVDANTDSTRQATDLSLYGAGTIECATCHNPHSTADLFLRQPAAGSAICLTCHIK